MEPLQRCQPLEISNLDTFFRTSIPDQIRLSDPPGNFLFYLDPLLPSTEQFRGKNVDLSVRDFNWLNTYPIRLSLI